MSQIESLIADLAAETGEDYDVVVRCSMGLWEARLTAKASPRQPLFDRRGEQQLCSGWDTTMAGALAQLNDACR